MDFCILGRSNSSSSEASTPEAGTPDCRQPPPLLRTISEGTYTTIDSLSSKSSSFSKSDLPVFDPQDAIIDDTCWDLKQRLSLEALKSSWKDESLDRVDSAKLRLNESLDRVDSAKLRLKSESLDRKDSANSRLKNESIKSCASIPNPAPYPNSQSSSVPGDVECTQL